MKKRSFLKAARHRRGGARAPVATGAGAGQGQGRADAQLVRLQRARAVLPRQGEAAIFDGEGIDLDIQEGRGSGVTVQAVAAGPATSATPTCRR